ncbi:MAG: hypothetical protein QXR65_08920 [Candidatus Bathyarchaeia archaeon]|nr:hypothetical protein [Candidatus Bathyarchaeota archaeon]
MSVEEVLSIIRSHPEAIAEALEKKPELLTSLILKLAPWDRFATKEDIKMLLDFMEKRFQDLRSYSDKRFEAMDKRFEELMSYSDKRFEAMDKRFEAMDKRFEAMDKRFEAMDKRFEAMDKRFEELMSYSDKRFEAIDKRFEDMNKRFEDLTHYVDKRVGLIEKLLIGFNIPILIAIITMLVRLFLF